MFAHCNRKCRIIPESKPGAFWPQQYDNPDNPASYSRLAEIIVGKVGRIDWLVGCVGSGGSLCGTTRYLRSLFPEVRAVAVNTNNSVLFGHEAGARLLRPKTEVKDRLSDASDAGQDEVDPGKELLAVVVFAQLRRHLSYERVLRGVELRPPIGDGREKGLPIRLAHIETGVRGVLSPDTENVVHERGRGIELRAFGDAQRLEPSSDALEELQRRGPPRLTEELGAHPWVRVDRVEHPKGDGADRLPRLGATDHPGHDTGDDVVGGRREQLVLIRNVPVYRPAPCRQTRRESTEGQSALTVGVEDLDRGFDDPLLGERVRTPFSPLSLCRHEQHLDTVGTLFQ